MNSVPDDLRGLLRLLEEAGGQEETWRPVRLPNGHLVRLTHADNGEWRFRYGFKGASVALEIPATERAIVAALAALKGKTTERLLRMRYASALSEGVERVASGEFDSLSAWMEGLRKDFRLEAALGRDWSNVPVARLLKELLRQYRPEFDELPEHKRAALMEQAAGHLNEFLDALRKFTRFLEAGDPTAGIPRTPLRITQEQLRAAELADIVELSHRQIGEALGLELNNTDKTLGGNQKAKERVRKGRELFSKAFGGQAGYWRYVEQKKQEVQRWNSLSLEERWAEDFGESFGIPVDSMLIIMTGDLEAAMAEVAKLAPEQVEGAIFARAAWEHWDLSDDPDSPLTLRADKT